MRRRRAVMVAVVASYMCLSRVYGFIQKIEVFPAFARASTKRERWCRSASMSASNAWHRREFKIAPSILSADLARLGEEVSNVMMAGGDMVHFDVMDNHFVPNLTIGPIACSALRNYGVKHDIDVHLMVSPVDSIIGDFAEAGASYITFHPEASLHIDRSLQLIQSFGCKSGLVFNPSTSLDCLKYIMDKVDIVLLMSVNPGFGGQSFIPSTLNKLREARALIDESGLDIRLEVDGGVGIGNIKEIAEAGADMFVAGSAIFRDPRTKAAYKSTIDSMRNELKNAVIGNKAANLRG